MSSPPQIQFWSSKRLHFLAALILISFALSHWAFFTLGAFNRRSMNTVFPFLTEEMVVFAVAVLETVAALFCFFLRGRVAANLIIMFFLTAIGWYRWAFFFTDGVDCHCVGILGQLFKLSKTIETLLSVGALILLGLSISPWIWKLVKGIQLRKFEVTCMMVTLIPTLSWAQSHAVISGEYESAFYGGNENAKDTNSVQRCSFTVVIAGTSWSICATNLQEPERWDRIIYDGTNIFVLTPQQDHIGEPAGSSAVFAAISRSPVLVQQTYSFVNIFLPWIAFGLSPQTISNAPSNSLPLPWEQARIDPSAFGYKWIALASPDGRFLQDCRVIRSTALDIDDQSEFLVRPELNNPLSITTWNSYMQCLRLRKRIPDGFLVAHYSCTNWLQTNGFSFPMLSHLSRYHPRGKDSLLRYRASIRTTRVMVEDATVTLAPPDSLTKVYDFRYRITNSTHIYRFADYDLRPGENWKSDTDPELLAKAQDWLKRGPKFNKFPMRKNFIAWLVFGGILLLPLVVMLLKRRKPKTQNPDE